MSSFAHRAELAAWRSATRPDALQCRLLFGVGPATLERIESGEVEPEADIAERIARHVAGQSKLPGSAFHAADPTSAAGCSATSAGGALFGDGSTAPADQQKREGS